MHSSDQTEAQEIVRAETEVVTDQPVLKTWSKPDLEATPLNEALTTLAGFGADIVFS